MDTIAQVRRAFYVHGWSVKKIVRELHVSRNTVRKTLKSNEVRLLEWRYDEPINMAALKQKLIEMEISLPAIREANGHTASRN